MFIRASTAFGVLAVMVSCIGFGACSTPLSPVGEKQVTVQLNRGPFTVRDFSPHRLRPLATVLFGSGDGGWGDLEEALARALQGRGYHVIGIDSEDYAQTDYNLETLQSDFGKMAEAAQSVLGNRRPPLIVGGYSMGAAQAIAVAGGPHPPQGLVGLLLVDPCSRGRYGLRTSDQMNILPTGPGTFAVADFARTMGSIRVVQWHAADDSIDSRGWLDVLTAQHQAFIFPDNGHSYDNNREVFVREFVQSADWILDPNRRSSGVAQGKMDR